MQRNMHVMHQNFRVLKSSIETTKEAASVKVFNHIVDNRKLIEEINDLRKKVTI